MGRIRAAFIATAVLMTGQVAFAQADFEQYVEKIRKAGMTEDAAGSLQMAAAILSGATVFEVKRAPDGSLGHSYSSAICFRPGADREKLRALREKIEAKQEAWLAFLKKYADTDGSGFVATDEGWALRRRVELGLLVPQVPDIKSVDDLAKAVHEDRVQVLADLAAYAKLQTEAANQGMEGMPVLPKHLAGAV